MSGNHTPTPWVYVHESTEYGAGDDDVTFGYVMQEGDEQYQIAPMIVDTIDGRANAEFIVTAVNSYASSQAEIERLRAALEPFVEILNLSEASALKDGRNPDNVPDTFDVLAFRNVPGLKLGAFRAARTALGTKP